MTQGTKALRAWGFESIVLPPGISPRPLFRYYDTFNGFQMTRGAAVADDDDFTPKMDPAEVNKAIENAALTGWLKLDPDREQPRLRGVELLELAMGLTPDPWNYDWELERNHPTLKGEIPVCKPRVQPPTE